MSDAEAVARTAALLKQRLGPGAPRIAVLLGSGWSPLAAEVQDAVDVTYAELPAFPVLAVGGRALWPAAHGASWQALPEGLRSRALQLQDWTRGAAPFDAVLLHGDAARRREVAALLAQRPGPIVSLHAFDSGDAAIALERLVLERSVSINTAAAGGNASLMTIG